MRDKRTELGRDLTKYKGVVVGLQLSLAKTTVKEFKADISAALEINRARIKWIEWQMGFRVAIFLCVCLVGCDPHTEPPTPPMGTSAGVETTKTLAANISAFCPGKCCCQHWANMTTANNHKIKYGDRLVAAPRNYPFGTWMTIEGYGRVQVKDRGGAISGSKLDVLFYEKSQDPTKTDIEWSHQLAKNWGRKFTEVIVELPE